MTVFIQSGRYSHIGRNSPKEDGWSLECGCKVHGCMGVALLGSSITKVYHHTVLGASQLQTIRIARSYTEIIIMNKFIT